MQTLGKAGYIWRSNASMFILQLGLILFSVRQNDAGTNGSIPSNMLKIPLNGYTRIDEGYVFECGTDNINDTIHIYDAVTHFNGTEIGWTSKDEFKLTHKHESHYSVERQLTNTSITLRITILHVQATDVGSFFCMAKLNGTHYFARLDIYINNLAPYSNTRDGAVMVGDRFFYECRIHYYGNSFPKFNWTSSDDVNGFVTPEIAATEGPGDWRGRKSAGFELGYELWAVKAKANRQMHGRAYTCISFLEMSYAADVRTIRWAPPGERVWAMNPPENVWNHTFKPLVVYYAPNVTIIPLRDTYEVGDRITMVVDARPVAGSYEWIGLTANLRFKSRRLTIIKQMIGTQTFLAKATNSPFGVDHSGDFQFTFYVPAPPTTTLATVTYSENWMHIGKPPVTIPRVPAVAAIVDDDEPIVYVKLSCVIFLLVAFCLVGCVVCRKSKRHDIVEEDSEYQEVDDDATHDNTLDEVAAWDDKIGGTGPDA